MSDLMKPPPNVHTAEQLALIRCQHRYEISGRWWHEQRAIAEEIEQQPLVRQLQDRVRRIEAHCVRCGVVRVLRYTTHVPPGEQIVLKDDAPGIPGSVFGAERTGEVIDAREMPPEEPAGVVDETELPLRRGRR